MVTITVAIAIGITRYRVGADVVLVFLGGVAIDDMVRLVRRRGAPRPGPARPRPARSTLGSTVRADARTGTRVNGRARGDVHCPLCGAADAVVWKASSITATSSPRTSPSPTAATARRSRSSQCRRCGFRFADPRTVPDLVALYGALDDPAYSDTAGVRRVQQRTLIEAIRRHRPDAHTLLDVGAANGLLVDEAGRAGMVGVGVEPSETLAAEARRSAWRCTPASCPIPISPTGSSTS